MIKRLLTICFSAFALTTAVQAQTPVKIATVDLEKVFREYYKSKDAESMLTERRNGIMKEVQEMRDDYQKMVDEINKLKEAVQDKTLSQNARDEKQKALDTKMQEAYNQDRKIQEFGAQRQRQFEDQSARMRQGIVDDIVKVVNDAGKKDSYSLVLDKSGRSMNGTPVLLYSQDVRDITDDVIKTINASKPATPAGSTPAPATAPATPPAAK